VEAARAERASERLAGLRVVGDDDSGREEAREHLPPTVVRLKRLVADRGVAEEINGRGVLGRRDLDGADGRKRVVEFERQLLVPGPDLGRLLAVFEFDLAARGNTRRADVDLEGARLYTAGRGADAL